MRSKLEKKYRSCILLAILGGCCLAVGKAVAFVFYLPGIILLAAVVVLDLSIRCPCCGRRLVTRRWRGIPDYCPDCGKAISDEEMEE